MSGNVYNNQTNVSPLIFTAYIVIKKNLRFEDHVTSLTQDLFPENDSLLLSLLLKTLLINYLVIKIKRIRFRLQCKFFKMCSFF